jgi:spermidine/putrescine-binding protein
MAQRPTTLTLSLSKLVFCYFLPASALANELTVYTWFEYFPESFINQFEKRSGHTVKLAYFYSDLERDTEIFNAQRVFRLTCARSQTGRGVNQQQENN